MVELLRRASRHLLSRAGLVRCCLCQLSFCTLWLQLTELCLLQCKTSRNTCWTASPHTCSPATSRLFAKRAGGRLLILVRTVSALPDRPSPDADNSVHAGRFATTQRSWEPSNRCMRPSASPTLPWM